MKKILLALLAVMLIGMPVMASAETNGLDETTEITKRPSKSKYQRARRQLPPRRGRAHVRPQAYRKGQPMPQHGVYGAPINRGTCVDKVSKKRKNRR